MNCSHCHHHYIKKGKSGSIQKYRCSNGGKYERDVYRRNSYQISDEKIIQLLKENVGIRGIGRVLSITPNTVIRRILRISKRMQRPFAIRFSEQYEVDELFTFVGNKNNRVCIAYSFNPETHEVSDIVVGKRSKKNLSKVISTLLLSNASKIITDKLGIYRDLIPAELHSTKYRGINHLERQNLNLRTHLKRLNRRTLCYSKSAAVLLAVVKIYFWY